MNEENRVLGMVDMKTFQAASMQKWNQTLEAFNRDKR
jgi:hypothetical protein